MDTWIKITGITAAVGLLATASIGSIVKYGGSSRPAVSVATDQSGADKAKLVGLGGLEEGKIAAWGEFGRKGSATDGR